MSILTRVETSSEFYNSNMLSIDYKQTEFCYLALRKYFKGTVACELGPSTGYMTKQLLNDFDELHVVEGAKNLLDQIPDHVKLVKFHSLFEDFTPPKKYDTIIMNHVLEHIEEPVNLLKQLKGWLQPDGILLIGVPNAKSIHRLAAVKMGMLSRENELNARDKELGHFRVYDFQTLVSDVEVSGWKVVDKGGVFLKFLSNAQIDKFFSEEMLIAFNELGADFSENAAEIFVVCKS